MYTIWTNKKAYHAYEILQTWEAGIILSWHEVKSIKGRDGWINEAIVRCTDQKLQIINMQVSLYKKTSPIIATHYNPKRPRELLVHKKEIAKIVAQTTKTGLAIVLLEIYVTKNHRIKAKIGTGKLRRKVEKKQILKEKDTQRQMEKDIKHMWL